jgi:hypothetical protein
LEQQQSSPNKVTNISVYSPTPKKTNYKINFLYITTLKRYRKIIIWALAEIGGKRGFDLRAGKRR